MTIDEIKELIHVVKESGIAELEVQRGDARVRIKLSHPPAAHENVYTMPVSPVASTAVPTAPLNSVAAPINAMGPVGMPPAEEAADTTLVKSPIVGTFYDAPSPGSPPFIKVGDHVNPGQVLCIIESMKLMNEIEAEISGVIVSKLVENGRPVEYGEALFAIRPN